MSQVIIQTIFPIACSADTAWHAAHSPAAAAVLYRPLLQMSPVEGTMPMRFETGSQVDVTLRLLGIIPVGSQRIVIEDFDPARFPPGSRSMRDGGRPLCGPLALLSGWNHEITVWPMGPSAAVWHDELTISGGFAPLLGLGLRLMWHWRRAKLRRLARTWAHEEAPQ